MHDYLKPDSSSTVILLADIPSSSSLSSSRSHTSKGGSRKTTNRAWNFLWPWRHELLAMFLIALVFFAVIVTLGRYQGLPLPAWPLGFSINTLLSIYGMLLKGPILFLAAEGLGQLKWKWLERTKPLHDITIYDEASRGPWGAVKLIRFIHLKHLSATVGAGITIFALGLDPFTQAVVSFYSCSFRSEGLATVSRMNVFGTAKSDPLLLSLPSTRLQLGSSAFDSGLVKVPFQCPTGNCTFTEPYHTIGFCSECEDVTASIVTECNDTSYIEQPPDYPACTHTLGGVVAYGGNEINLTVGLRGYAGYFDFVMGYWDLMSTHIQHRRGNPSIGRAYESAYTVSMIATSYKAQNFAVRCELKVCTRTYTSEVQNGQLVETLKSTSTNWGRCEDTGCPPAANGNMMNYPGVSYEQVREAENMRRQMRVDCLPADTRDRLISDGMITNGTEWSPWNSTWYFPAAGARDIAAEYDIPPRCMYQYDSTSVGSSISTFNGTIKARQRLLEPSGYSLWRSDIDIDGMVPGNDSLFSNWSLVADPFLTIDNNGPLILTTLYDGGNLTFDTMSSAMDNYTTTLTNFWRMNGTSAFHNATELLGPELFPERPYVDLQPAEGFAYQQTSCINVKWQWLGLPAALILGTVVFLGMLISENGAETEMWRSSQAALLWHGLEGPVIEEGAQLNNAEDMNTRAKELTVKLRRVGGVWKLVETPLKKTKT